ncbi:MAG: hypothetical protein HC903_31825 [Methylacidiphilales bacterium]|nr:hypothetical protein [Candidatus Methylacidiphilales bacterium]NJR17491.1 hypothetical protein [Calothrix sp. CSU_2_0]
MKPTRRNFSQTKANSSVCHDRLWFLSFLFPLEREFLSGDCWQNRENIPKY